MSIIVKMRPDSSVRIFSDLGEFYTDLQNIQSHPQFRFVLSAISSQAKYLRTGFDLKIESDFSANVGLGSSAAVTAATTAALFEMANRERKPLDIFQAGLETVRKIQGTASGADLAAAVFGGIISYRMQPLSIEKSDQKYPLTVVYSGTKLPTTKVINIVEEKRQRHPKLFASIFELMGKSALQAAEAIKKNKWQKVGELLNINQGLMDAIGVNNRVLSEIVYLLRREPEILGAKISGSGLGDCVVGLGSIQQDLSYQILPVEISTEGILFLNKKDVVRVLLGGKNISAKTSASAFASSNIALCKYWGKRNEELNLPVTSSLSVSLGHLGTRTKISFSSTADRIVLNDHELANDAPFARRLISFLDLFRSRGEKYIVETKNNFPTAAGLASSASGFAALVLALDDLYEWRLTKRELSILARLGSGSASRSIFNGFVEWQRGSRDDGMDSFAQVLAKQWPELRLGVVTVADEQKAVASRAGMRRTTETSKLYRSWPLQVEKDLRNIKEAIQRRDFELFGKTAESNALAMHATMLAAWPPLLYWKPQTVLVFQKVWEMREAGVPVYFTIDAGPNVKLLFLESQFNVVREDFHKLEIVTPFIR